MTKLKKKKNRYTKKMILLVTGLAVLGLFLVFLRFLRYSSVKPREDYLNWNITYSISFSPNKKIARLKALLPHQTEEHHLLKENISYSKMDVEIQTRKNPVERILSAVSQLKIGYVKLEAQFNLRKNLNPGQFSQNCEVLSHHKQQKYLDEEINFPVRNPIVFETLQNNLHINENDRTHEKLIKIFNFCLSLHSPSQENTPLFLRENSLYSNVEAVLTHLCATPTGKRRTMTTLCRACGIPSRISAGLQLEDREEAKPRAWVEAHMDNAWIPFDPETGLSYHLPENIIPMGYNTDKIIDTQNTRHLITSIYAKKNLPPVELTSRESGTFIALIDFTRLPSRIENVLAVLLLMPLGGLITSVFHNILGLKTFGHFTPTLLAVSFMYAELIPGIITFLAIFIVGFSSRFFVEHLKLTKRPRVSLVLISVSITLAFTVSAMDYLGLEPGSRAILLPMVAISLLIERFTRNTYKAGFNFAVGKLTGTLAAACCSLLLFRIDGLQWFFINFPEVEFIIAAALILVGLYREKDDKSKPFLKKGPRGGRGFGLKKIFARFILNE